MSVVRGVLPYCSNNNSNIFTISAWSRARCVDTDFMLFIPQLVHAFNSISLELEGEGCSWLLFNHISSQPVTCVTF